ncbi:MAG: hypothetical protein ABFQ89_04630 [Chloroflexota bacterium]
MIRKSDIRWWISEVEKHPEAASDIVDKLAQRLVELDQENERLRDRLVHLEKTRTAGSDAQSKALRHEIKELKATLGVKSSSSLLVAWDSGRMLRVPISRLRLAVQQRKPLFSSGSALGISSMCMLRPGQEVLVITNEGRLTRVRPEKTPTLDPGNKVEPESLIELAEYEQIALLRAYTHAPRFWTIVTRRGNAGQLMHAQVNRLAMGSWMPLTWIEERDPPASICEGDQGDLMTLTTNGMVMRIPHRLIGKPGTSIIKLEDYDRVHASASVKIDQDVVLVTASGMVWRLDLEKVKRYSSPGKLGQRLIRTHDLLSAFAANDNRAVAIVRTSGKVSVIHPSSIKQTRKPLVDDALEELAHDPGLFAVDVPRALMHVG